MPHAPNPVHSQAEPMHVQAEAATAAAEVALLEQADIKEMWDADLDSFLEVSYSVASSNSRISPQALS